jgi:CO dehydrogenase/acetyl-CoA synthase delta subunit
MFNLDDVEVITKEFEPIPDGSYVMQVIEAEAKRTKAGTGTYVKATFEVLEGEFRGRRIWHNFNTQNPNPQAVQIGLQQLKTFFVAAGVKSKLNFETEADIASQLEGQSAVCLVTTKHSQGYDPQNEIKTFKPYAATPKKTGMTQTKTGSNTVRRRPTDATSGWDNL